MTDTPEKMPLTSMDIAAEKRDALKELFPEVFSEDKIDFDQLKRVLGEWVESGKERFGLTWPGKAECMRIIQSPSIATLKPDREQSVNFDETENVFIEGDNLEVLKLLQKSYFGKVKMIYIDPPYNTGKEFIYPDKYEENIDTYLAYTGQTDEKGRKFSTNTDAGGRYHSNWLNMIYLRLYLAKNLLQTDGYICVSIGEDEVGNLRSVLDDIFGEENFINCISVLSKVAAGASGGGEDKRLKKNIEYILVYCRDSSEFHSVSHVHSKLDLMDVINQMKEDRKSWKYTSIITGLGERSYFGSTQDGDGNEIKIFKRTGFTRTTINAVIKSEGLTEEQAYKNNFEGIFSDTNAQTSIRTRVIDAVGSLNADEILDVEYVPRSGKDKGQLVSHQYISNTVRRVIWLRDVAELENTKIFKREKVGTFWGDIDYNNIGREAETPFPNGKKPIKLIQKCLSIAESQEGLCLDFFAGSGSLGHAVYDLNAREGTRWKFLLVQLPEVIDQKNKDNAAVIAFCKKHGLPFNLSEVSRQRLRNSRTEDLLGAKVDTGFRTLSLSKSSFRLWFGESDELEAQIDLHVQNVETGAISEDIVYEPLLKSGFPLTTKVEAKTLAGKTVYRIG